MEGVETVPTAVYRPGLAAAPYDGTQMLPQLGAAVATLRFEPSERNRMLRACTHLCTVLDTCSGVTLQERWMDFEQHVWPDWLAGHNRPAGSTWTWGVRAIVTAQLVQPGWELLSSIRVSQWVARLPADAALVQQAARLQQALATITWSSASTHAQALNLGLRLLLWRGYTSLDSITEQDIKQIPPTQFKGNDALDAALCALGVFTRTPQRGTSRYLRVHQHSPAELVANSDIPEHFRSITIQYLETYAVRISDTYATLRQKHLALAHFWRFLTSHYPEVRRCADILPLHARAFVPYAIASARLVQRGRSDDDAIRITAHSWLVNLRTFFADICTWATEPGSPFAADAPRTIPLTRHDLVGLGFEKARRQSAARLTATVLDLEHEMPNIRAYAFRRWSEEQAALPPPAPGQRYPWHYVEAFWDWAILELLVQSGLRIEEACTLTTLDILKRQLPDGRVYYLLHIKPSKYDRARVIPIGDSLGRVIAEIIRHVKQFYGSAIVPCCDQWDWNEKRALPPAPYLLQAMKHPSPIGVTTIRGRLRALSMAAGARKADGSPLILLPHDCRRVFASEHLNNNTPVHVIQALLGHATIETVMVYAKLYPSQLIEEYRKVMRGTYLAMHGEESLRNPTLEEWQAFAASCSMRDMGTHLCALPTGEHCPKGLVCLGCVHAQPKKSATGVFRRMLASHERALRTAKERGEPAGQIAARELEVARLRTALQRAEALTEDVASAIEGVLEEG
jgi:integrase